jgi:hypothetical protein
MDIILVSTQPEKEVGLLKLLHFSPVLGTKEIIEIALQIEILAPRTIETSVS